MKASTAISSSVFVVLLHLSGCGHFKGPGPVASSIGNLKSPSDYQQAPRSLRGNGWEPEQSTLTLQWPVDQVHITQPFRPSKNPDHQGIDLSGRRGTPILAAHDGIVVYAGRGYRGYGKMIILEFDRRWASLYAHLNSLHVKEGDVVARGQKLGTMGRTGRATGVHLHFELMQDKLPVDPLEYLQPDRLAASDQ